MSIFTHKAKIISIENHTLELILSDEVPCSSCALHGACGANQNSIKNIRLVSDKTDWSINENVNLIISENQAFTASVLVYFLPVFLIFISIFIGTHFLKEWVVGILVLLELGLYFLILKLGKNYIDNWVKMKVEKL